MHFLMRILVERSMGQGGCSLIKLLVLAAETLSIGYSNMPQNAWRLQV